MRRNEAACFDMQSKLRMFMRRGFIVVCSLNNFAVPTGSETAVEKVKLALKKYRLERIPVS